jgi:inorganic pyrophosphatase
MNLDKVTPGDKSPDEVNVIIEIPLQSQPVKYEVDKKTGAMFVDRFLTTAMYYPCNYGYIPRTLSQDGDPVDVLVITPFPLVSGTVIRCRPIGVLQMADESGNDAKLLAVPIDKLSTLYRHIKTYEDVSPHLLATISHFFEHYKDLESEKWVKVQGWQGVEHAKKEILESVDRYKTSGIKG